MTRFSIDGGPPTDGELVEKLPDLWIAGPFLLGDVDIQRRLHTVTIIGGERNGCTASATHTFNTAAPQTVFLNGTGPFTAPFEDPYPVGPPSPPRCWASGALGWAGPTDIRCLATGRIGRVWRAEEHRPTCQVAALTVPSNKHGK
jgi:hypothetical protein